MPDLTIADAAALTGAGTASGDLFPLLDVSASAGNQGSKITRDELRIAMGITGGGTLATGGFTLTVPATGTAALLGTANVFTAAQTINAGTRTGAALTLSQTWNNAGVACRGFELAVTNTNSASGSTLLRILGGAAGATQMFNVDNNGWINGPSGATMVLAPASGHNMLLYVTGGGNISCNAVIEAQGGISVVDARNITFATTTGTRIGTGATQKIGFWNATPVVQQVLATGGGATVDNVISFLQTIGLCKQS